MNIEATLSTLMCGNQLKQTARTGWSQRGVADAENVAAHSYGVAYTVLLLAPLVSQPIDLGKALAIAVLHDLPESLTSDIPSPAWRLMPEGVKPLVENRAMESILGSAAGGKELLATWRELHEYETAEARLVSDADQLDLYLQALIYEEQTGNRRLGEFWQRPAEFHFPEAHALYEELVRRRQRDAAAPTDR
ncbi:MAG: HD family hydrolase [Chloroflexota bacterium]|nr:MAG: HD family hydrolase [Chloroflexota bacterium]